MIEKLIERMFYINDYARSKGFANLKIFNSSPKEHAHELTLIVSIQETFVDKISLFDQANLKREIEKKIEDKIIILIDSTLDKSYLQVIQKTAIAFVESNKAAISKIFQQSSKSTDNMTSITTSLQSVTEKFGQTGSRLFKRDCTKKQKLESEKIPVNPGIQAVEILSNLGKEKQPL